MFERFTEEARQVISEAQHAARQLRHQHIGTEHLLLGLATDTRIALWIEDVVGATADMVAADVTRICGQGGETVLAQLPFNPRAKKVLEIALREALGAGHNYIAPAHLLLGLVREAEGVAYRILVARLSERDVALNLYLEARHLLPEPTSALSGLTLEAAERSLARKREAEADKPTIDFGRLTIEEAEQLIDLLRKGAGEPAA